MKAADRREQVLTCAAELFARQGYHRTTISHIVAHAGVARGTFYLYFKDKRSIFDELLDRFIQAIDARIIRIDPALGLLECLRLMRQNLRTVFEISFEEQPFLAKILISDAVGLDDEFDQKLLEFDEVATELIASALELGQDMGVVRPCNRRITALFVLGALKEMLYQVLMRGMEVDIDEVVEELLSLLRAGVLQLPDA